MTFVAGPRGINASVRNLLLYAKVEDFPTVGGTFEKSRGVY